MKAAVVLFPGSSCDCARSLKAATGVEADLVWHKQSSIFNYDLLIIPGGFSFGDYLRAGALACLSPVMSEIKRLAERGNFVIGIGNGFQILTEAHILPGAFQCNKGLNYLCKDIYLKVENNKSHFTSVYGKSAVISLPIGHGEGNYYAGYQELEQLKEHQGIVFRYCDQNGRTDPHCSPDGSTENIAGIVNAKGNVLGMMPHPERMAEKILGGESGKKIWESIFRAVA